MNNLKIKYKNILFLKMYMVIYSYEVSMDGDETQMLSNEILQMIIKNSITKKQVIEDTNDLICEIQKDYKDFIYKLSEELKEYCESIQKCPLCGGDIVQIKKYVEDMGEYLGQPVEKEIITYGCDECKYIAY